MRSCWHGSRVLGSGGRSSLSILMKAREVSRIRRIVAPPGPISRRACSLVITRVNSAAGTSYTARKAGQVRGCCGGREA
eukprot:scaffold15022_cov117-Isochrysis_galbana.AAC.17